MPLGVPIQVTRRQASLTDAQLATAETIEVMADQAVTAGDDAALRAASSDAVRRFRGGPLYAAMGIDPRRNPAAIAESFWWAAKHALRFEHHEDTIRVWFNERDQLQLLISPDLLVRLGPSKGDCAIYTTLICAMLRAWRIPYEFVTVAADPFAPDIFGHVYCRAVMPDGARIALDASHGLYPGWEVPRQHVIRKAIWDESGNEIPDEATKQFRGLHSYLGPGFQRGPQTGFGWYAGPGFQRGPAPGFGDPGPGANRGFNPGFGRLGRRRGLGQTITGYDSSGNPIYDYGNTTVLNYPGMPTGSTTTLNYPGMPQGTVTNVPVTVPSTPTTGPGSGSNWAGFFQSLSNQGLNLVGKVVAPTTTIQSGPGGTFIQTPAGSALPTSPLSLGAGAGGGSWLLIGGVVLVIVLVASGKH